MNQKKSFYWTIVMIFMVLGCHKETTQKVIPECIKAKIKVLEQEPPRKAAIWQYDYDGKTVYYVASGCCDQYNLLFDSDCNIICSPDGGISGDGDGRCSDFYAKSKNKTLVWEDKR